MIQKIVDAVRRGLEKQVELSKTKIAKEEAKKKKEEAARLKARQQAEFWFQEWLPELVELAITNGYSVISLPGDMEAVVCHEHGIPLIYDPPDGYSVDVKKLIKVVSK